MNKQISTPWAVTVVVLLLLVVGIVIWRYMTPPAPLEYPTGGAAGRTLGHAGSAPATPPPPGPR